MKKLLKFTKNQLEKLHTSLKALGLGGMSQQTMNICAKKMIDDIDTWDGLFSFIKESDGIKTFTEDAFRLPKDCIDYYDILSVIEDRVDLLERLIGIDSNLLKEYLEK